MDRWHWPFASAPAVADDMDVLGQFLSKISQCKMTRWKLLR